MADPVTNALVRMGDLQREIEELISDCETWLMAHPNDLDIVSKRAALVNVRNGVLACFAIFNKEFRI